MSSIFYNTQHSPMGAFASFTLGAKGAKGGLAIELGKPADQRVFIGLENEKGGTYSCLPFFSEMEDESANFEVDKEQKKKNRIIREFADKEISRTLSPCIDEWKAGDLTFAIHSPVASAPNPNKSSRKEQELAYVPALAAEITVDNSKGKKDRRFFFGYQGTDPYTRMWHLEETTGGKIAGIASGSSTAIACDAPGVYSVSGFTAEGALEESYQHNKLWWTLGNVALLVGTVPAGKKKTFPFAICFYRSGIVTTGMEASYYYTHFFKNIEDVASYALKNFSAVKSRGKSFETRFQKSRINSSRKFQLSQAIHSYYGSTELLDVKGEPMWIVNEGEYRMMNTFDLTADQLFFEMELNSWTVANELDWFVKRYSYTDKIRLPGNDKEYAGGISFAHDMGVANHFSQPGYSTYEMAGKHGCFSHMTQEELSNWLMCALVYAKQSGDSLWVKRSLKTFRKCLDSMVNRDHPDPLKRDGIMSLDSTRCEGGSEITTYDSLDVSLGQARNNLYLAVKNWAIYVGFADLFEFLKDSKRSALCKKQAALSAKTIIASSDKKGLLPAVLYENIPSRIIPAVEGLILPYELGLKSVLDEKGEYGLLISTLKKHLKSVLKKGVCIFPNGAWKISSTSTNTWLSKIYLCQFVSEKILGFTPDEKADKAHALWLTDEANGYWAWSDQIVSGVAKGSKYYPRGVTSILWLRS